MKILLSLILLTLAVSKVLETVFEPIVSDPATPAGSLFFNTV